MDFTFKNQLLKKYFEGDNSYIPTSELIYLHDHPMVKPNFMTELSQLIKEAGDLMVKHKLLHYSDRLSSIAIRMGKELPEITEDNARVILGTMREAYQLSNELLNSGLK